MFSDPGGVQAFMHKFLFTHIGSGRKFIKFLFIQRPKFLHKIYTKFLVDLCTNLHYIHWSWRSYGQILYILITVLTVIPNFTFILTDHVVFSPKFSFLLIGLDQCFVLKWIHYIYSQFCLHSSGSALTIIFILLYLYYIILLFLYYIIFLLYIFHVIIFLQIKELLMFIAHWFMDIHN